MVFEQLPTDVSSRGQEPEPVGRWSKLGQEHDGSAVPSALWEIRRIGVLDEIDQQQLIISRAAAALIDTETCPVVAKSDAAPLKFANLRALVRTGTGCWTSFAPGEDFGSLL